MSRPQKKHKPLKGAFNEILAAVAMGRGRGKKAAKELQTERGKPPQSLPTVMQPQDTGPSPEKL
jgi:hypothetical protein